MQIIGRIDCSRRRLRRPADQTIVDDLTIQHALRRKNPMRSIAGADHPDMGIANDAPPVLVIEQENPGDREIAFATGEFAKGPAPVRGPMRQIEFGDDFVRPAQRGPVKKSSARTTRDPAGPTSVICASQVTATPGSSAAGSAWARLPPTVPRLRI